MNEDFIGYDPTDSVNTASLSNAILQKLEDCSLECKLRKGHALCLNQNQVSVLVYKNFHQLVEYHYCHAHALNLVISSLFKNIHVMKNLHNVNQLLRFLAASRKRVLIIKRHIPNAKQANYLLQISKIRWSKVIKTEVFFCEHLAVKLCKIRCSARIVSLSVVIGKYASIFSSLEVLRNESSDVFKNKCSDKIRPSFLAFKLLPGEANTLTRHELEDKVERF